MGRTRALGCWALALAWLLASCATTEPSAESEGPQLVLLDRPGDPNFGSLVVRGLSAQARERLVALPEEDDLWEDLLVVYTGAGVPEPGQQPILGTTNLEGEVVRFRPRFPLVVGLEHFATFRGGSLGVADCALTFSLSAPEPERRTRVLRVDPGLEEVPANLLRIYVTFSEPMYARDVQRHVRVLDSDNKRVLDPFVDIPNGLWDEEQRRLTLFFDPGRIKRGVGPNEVLGPPLREGETYRLVVGQELEDARGAALVEGFTWTFRTVADDRSSPDPQAWTLIAPSRSSAALELVFGKALDRALLERLVHVEDSEGNALAGEVRVTEGGGRWAFTPVDPWLDGEFFVVVQSALEDLSGNAVGHRFEERLDGAPVADGDSLARLSFRVSLAP